MKSHKPDFEQFLKVLRREGRPSHLPFYEHFASPGFIAERMDRKVEEISWDNPEFPLIHRDFWLGMGFDCIPMEIGLNCSLPQSKEEGLSQSSEARACIHNMNDFENYTWPDISSPIDFSPFEKTAAILPDGVKIVGGVCAGPFEWCTSLMGYEGLCLAQVSDPELFALMFRKLGELHNSAVRQLASMDGIGALRQGDDLGFKTSTFLAPEVLREHVLPIYKDMVETAHAQGKPFILHSCGNLESIYEDLIDWCGIDGKHSFEDAILPVGEFKKQFDSRVTPLGGLDVDWLCRRSEEEIRAYVRKTIEACFDDGYWALGTGNSLTDYLPVSNYLFALDEGRRIA